MTHKFRAELAQIAAHIDGYPGTTRDLLSDWAAARENCDAFAQQTGDHLAQVIDEMNGLLK